MPGNALNELDTQKNCSPTRVHDGSGAKPLIIGFLYDVILARDSKSTLAPKAWHEIATRKNSLSKIKPKSILKKVSTGLVHTECQRMREFVGHISSSHLIFKRFYACFGIKANF